MLFQNFKFYDLSEYMTWHHWNKHGISSRILLLFIDFPPQANHWPIMFDANRPKENTLIEKVDTFQSRLQIAYFQFQSISINASKKLLIFPLLESDSCVEGHIFESIIDPRVYYDQLCVAVWQNVSDSECNFGLVDCCTK